MESLQHQEMQSKIMIIDDEKVNIDILVGLLKQHTTVAARSGEQALKLLNTCSLPDLILLDVLMPDMDGFEVCRKIQADEKTRKIPIIFLTVKNEVDDIVSGFEAGAVDYITKPFRPKELSIRVTTHLRLKHTITALETALAEIKTLKGMLPICSACKKIRDDKGYWNQIEYYIENHSNATFTHGMCPDCINIYYADLDILND